MKKIVLTISIFITGVSLISGSTVAADNATTTAGNSTQSQMDATNLQIANLNQQIAEYQSELKKIGANKRTLQQAINALDLQLKKVKTQVNVTQYQINETQLQIKELGGEIVDTKQAIRDNQAALYESLRNLQKADGQALIVQVFSSGGLIDAWNDMNNNIQIQGAVQSNIGTLLEQQGNLANSQAASMQKQQMLTSQKQLLASQQQSLASTQRSKNDLLSETKAKESNYQKLLAEAEAELNSFSAFVESEGGSKLLPKQTDCDSWGCYYNQRDLTWGVDPLNGTNYTLATAGCLVTSMAMVMTHYGYRNVTPVSINSNPDNFASYYPAYMLMTVNVDGVSATRIAARADAILATGNPVIAGVRIGRGTHFIVLVSGRKGNYIMRDPYVPNGKDVKFSDHYSLRSIFSIAKVQISG